MVISGKIRQRLPWVPEDIPDISTIPIGDMPGDKVNIGPQLTEKAQIIFPELLELLITTTDGNPYQRGVVAVCGGSGAGKSGIASLLSCYLNRIGVGSYTLSGDNYPHRIPKYNDAERLRIFWKSGIAGLISHNLYTKDRRFKLKEIQEQGNDSNTDYVSRYPWLSIYQNAGRNGLKKYLGTQNEIDFKELSGIISQFKNGKSAIFLKRMGREETDLWYESVDFSDINVLIIEWTHGNNNNLKGVDIPILLNSTPLETLEYRRSRNRDTATDSPFTSMVLQIEQDLLISQARKAKLIVSRRSKIITYSDLMRLVKHGRGYKENTLNIYAKIPEKHIINANPMFNSYPDSIGGTLGDMVKFLQSPELKEVFQSFYILPSIFNTDLDRGFSVIDYELNGLFVSKEDLMKLNEIGITLKLDFVLNHSSLLSKQFQDILKNGDNSIYKDFFINWNKFWEGFGKMTDYGYIQPKPQYIRDMFFRKPGLPILNVRMPNGKEVPYWNTFYQEIRYEKIDILVLMSTLDIQYLLAHKLAEIVNNALSEGKKPSDIEFGSFEAYRNKVIDILESRRKYFGQMDLNIKSPLVWEYYENTLKKLAGYGAEIIRLDAFAYALKEPGAKNFLNEPGTWDLLGGIKSLADKYGLTLLPEIHSRYEEKIHEKLSQKGFMTYDFFLPGLIIDAFERNTNEFLIRWIKDIQEKGIRVVNMLGCHDGIPILDLKGLLADEQILKLIDIVVKRGGYVKELHGKKNIYYQVNATYYSALGEDDAKLILARAIQIFMPGKPQVWYLDLLAGKNDHAAVEKAGLDGHKEINRTNLTLEQAFNELGEDIVLRQLSLLRFRNTFPAFGFDAKLRIPDSQPEILKLCWENHGCVATLEADLKDYSCIISASDEKGNVVFNFR